MPLLRSFRFLCSSISYSGSCPGRGGIICKRKQTQEKISILKVEQMA